jgi:hypothetical protein
MLVEERDETARRGYRIGYSLEEVKEHLRERFGNDIFD